MCSSRKAGYLDRIEQALNRGEAEFTLGILVFRVPSQSRPGEVHDLSVDPQTLQVWCSCEQFWFRIQPKGPIKLNGPLMCSHQKRVIAYLEGRMGLGNGTSDPGSP